MDVRGPYGSLNFDGAANRDQGDAIGGVAWGDFGLEFTTTDAQLTLNSPWTYDTANTRELHRRPGPRPPTPRWGSSRPGPLDKEMGYPDRVYGRERGSTSADAYLNKRDCTGVRRRPQLRRALRHRLALSVDELRLGPDRRQAGERGDRHQADRVGIALRMAGGVELSTCSTSPARSTRAATGRSPPSSCSDRTVASTAATATNLGDVALDDSGRRGARRGDDRAT